MCRHDARVVHFESAVKSNREERHIRYGVPFLLVSECGIGYTVYCR